MDRSAELGARPSSSGRQRVTPEVCRLTDDISYHSCTFKTKRPPRRLANVPLSERMRERINLSCSRDDANRYCYMLYRAAHAKVVFKENRRCKVEEFASCLEKLKLRVPHPVLNGERSILIPIRNAITGVTRLAKFEKHATYVDLHRETMSLFGQATPISMRLTIAKTGWILDSRANVKLGRGMHNTELECLFYK